MKKFFFGCLAALVFYLPALALDLTDYTLKRGVGVRAAGMGSTGTAIMVDGSAIFYNPANLAQPGLTFTYGNPDTNQKDVDGRLELAKLGYLGLGSWHNKAGVSDEVSVSTVGFGNRVGWLNWGVAFKTIGAKLTGVESQGWSTDLGFLARVTPQFKLGFLAADLLTSKTSLVGASGRLGFGYDTPNSFFTFAGDAEFQGLNKIYGHLGLEARVAQGLALRAGIDRSEPTVGLTLDLAFFTFDYGALFQKNGQTVQRFETGIKFLPDRERPFSFFKNKEYALIDISGAIKGGRTEYSFLGGTKPGLDSILSQIRRASADGGINGIMVKIGGFDGGLGGMAVVQEIRFELGRARAKGKKIVAYLENGATGDEYYLASFADKIVAPPGAAVGGLGKSLAIYRIKGLYEKFGIEWQVITQGEYKNVFDPYSAGLTDKQRQMVQGLVADLYRKMLTDIAQDRKITLEKIKSIGDGLIFTAKEAQTMGLIDEIGYLERAEKVAGEIAGDKKNKANLVAAQLVEPEDFLLARAFGVAVIEIDGEIVSGRGGENVLFGGSYVGAESIIDYLKKASDDVFVKAIILRVNSPGGEAIAAGEIYEACKYAKEKGKVLIASIGDIGASGGYYIAAAADKIVADPSSITGSIGVIGHVPVFAKLLKKLNVTSEVIKEGKHADMFSGLRSLTTAEISAIKHWQAESYDEFIQAVVTGRKMATAEVKAVAQGKIYTGSQALDLKLVDKLGGFSDAVDLAKEQAKIIGEPRLIFYHQPSFFNRFGSGLTDSLGFKDVPLLNYWPGFSALGRKDN